MWMNALLLMASTAAAAAIELSGLTNVSRLSGLVNMSELSGSGPYTVVSVMYTDPALDESDQHVYVLYPKAHGQTFPLISYAHGFNDPGGDLWYSQLGLDMASWGYVVGFPASCTFGCLRDCKSELGDPPCFGNYWRQQALTIEWARAQSSLPINLTAGVGVAGHSMGGQATLFSASNASAVESLGIKAAVLHHPYTHRFPAIQVPFIVFTGTLDDTAPASWAAEMFHRKGACATRGLVNKRGANHHEPSTDYNPRLGLYTVAWFKLYVDGVRSGMGIDFDSMVYGTANTSLCGGGDGAMQVCDVLRGAGVGADHLAARTRL